MNNLPSIETYTTPKTKLNQRQYLLQQFISKLNSERGEYPEINPKVLAIRMSKIKTDCLYGFLKECQEARQFSNYFWWKIKK